MRGYVTFLLVFASLSLIIASSSMLAVSHSPYFPRTLEVERAAHLSMNIKESISEAASYGLKQGAYIYDTTTLPEERTPQARDAALRASIFSSLSKLPNHTYDPDYEIIIWCGYVSQQELDSLPEEMLEQEEARMCEGCAPLDNLLCASFLEIKQEPDSVLLKGPLPTDPLASGIIGISVYSEKYGIAQVSHFPVSEEIT